jgi:DNA polymerase-3 subunit beta
MLLLEAERDSLLFPLQTVTGVVEKRHTLPILSNVLIEKNAGVLAMTATDLEIQIRTSTQADATEDNFAITVSAKKLQDICRALPDKANLRLEVNDEQIQIKAGKSRFNLQTLPAADFPVIESSGETESRASLSQKSLKHLISRVQYAMAQQDIRYYLNGMLLVLNGKTIMVIATDGHRLSFASAEMDQESAPQEIIVPRKTVQELGKQLADSDDLIHIEVRRNQVAFNFARIERVSKIIEGKFPDYNRVIPSNHTNVLKVARVALLQALQRVAILSNEKFRGVRLVLNPNELRIICNNNEQEEAQEELEVDYQGAALDIGFNVSYLLDALNNLTCDSVQCLFGDANSSMLLVQPDDASFKYVVMPMRI